MTALARSIDSNDRWTTFYWNYMKIEGLGNKWFFIIHPYF